MTVMRLLLLFIFTLATIPVEAAKYRRLVNFEWEAIEGAASYEIELTPVREKEDSEEAKIFNFKVDKASWNGRLTPGKYLMRLRSRDYRGVPGDWSPASDFNVGLDQVVLKSPIQEVIPSTAAEKEMMEFRWEAVGGAEQYQFELTSEDGKTQISQTLKDNSLKIELPVAAVYNWKVSATSAEGIISEGVSSAKFSLQGKKIPTPELEKPESPFVRQIKWTTSPYAKGYDVIILRRDDKTKKFEKFQVIENTTSDTLDFDSSWPGGLYKVAVKAHGDLRPSSDLGKMSFAVRSGDRSPAAEYTALVKKSIDRVTGWYGIASYLVTEMKFTGIHPEKARVSYDAMGGTGRLGLGWFNPNTPWGFLSIIDMSGFVYGGKLFSFASAEVNAIYRKNVGDRAEFRFQAGPYYKELPETSVDSSTGQVEDSRISSAGPHIGGELWYSLTPKIGIQLNAHFYASLIKIDTPNGQNLNPSVSTQMGILGSYRFTPKFTGLLGYTRREDRVKYGATPGSSSSTSGDQNESTIVGNYLNFFAEWAF